MGSSHLMNDERTPSGRAVPFAVNGPRWTIELAAGDSRSATARSNNRWHVSGVRGIAEPSQA